MMLIHQIHIHICRACHFGTCIALSLPVFGFGSIVFFGRLVHAVRCVGNIDNNLRSFSGSVATTLSYAPMQVDGLFEIALLLIPHLEVPAEDPSFPDFALSHCKYQHGIHKDLVETNVLSRSFRLEA
jgi:hypothetical protein